MTIVSRAKARLEQEDGVILVLAALLLVVLFGVAAFAIDISLKGEDRQALWNTADAAALAGASQLPDDPAGAAAEAFKFALLNDPELAGELIATYRCIVGDRDNDGLPDPSDVPAACNPGADFGMTAPPWICADGKCSAVCFPAEGDTCNTLVMEVKKTTDFAFAPVIGIDEGETGILSAACRGACGAPLTGPLDLMLIIDRTTSMSPGDLLKAKKASLALLDFLDPSLQHVGLAAINAGDDTKKCQPQAGNDWLLVPLNGLYKDSLNYDFDGDGVPDLDGTNPLVSTLKPDCLKPLTGTDLGSPITGVRPHLLTSRPGVKKAIILLSDGAAWLPDSNSCKFALEAANAAKAQGVEVFTIGFGIDDEVCKDDEGDYTEGGGSVSQLLAAMATNSVDNYGCKTPGDVNAENGDGDNFFCLPKTSDLSSIFLAAASQLAGGSKLIQLPPG